VTVVMSGAEGGAEVAAKICSAILERLAVSQNSRLCRETPPQS
jgi:hypothetical protein